MQSLARARFPRRQPLLTRVPRSGSASEAVRRPRPAQVLAEPRPRWRRALVLPLRPPLQAPPAPPAVVPLGPLVLCRARPWRGAWLLYTGHGILRQPLPQPPSPPPGPSTRRFARPARPDVRLERPAGRDTALARPARQDIAFTRGPNSIMSISSNLSWFRGEDVTVDFTLTPVVDITGWTISFTLKDTLGGNTQTGFPITAAIVDGPRGRFRVAIPSSATSSIPAGRYVWDARRTDAGNRATLADGYLDLKQEVTP